MNTADPFVFRTLVLSLSCLVLLGPGCANAPDSPEVMLERAKILMDRGDVAEAVSLLNNVLKSRPLDPDAWFQRGLAYENLELPEKALEDYTACLKLDSLRTDALNNKAVQLAKLKKYDEAIADFTELVDLDPDDFLGYRNRGLCRFDMQDYAGALLDYAIALKLNPDDASSWFQRGNVHLSMKTLEAAESDFSKAIELDPKFAKAWMNRGVARYRNGEKELAAKDLTRSQELDGNIALPGLEFFSDNGPAASATEVMEPALWDSCRPLIEKDLSDRGFTGLVFVREFPDLRCAELTGKLDGQPYKVLVTCQAAGQSSVTLPCPDLSADAESVELPYSLLVLRLIGKKGTVAKVTKFEQKWNPDAEEGEPVIMNYDL